MERGRIRLGRQKAEDGAGAGRGWPRSGKGLAHPAVPLDTVTMQNFVTSILLQLKSHLKNDEGEWRTVWESGAPHAFLHLPCHVTLSTCGHHRGWCPASRVCSAGLPDVRWATRHECGSCLQPLLFTASRTSAAGDGARASRLVQALGTCPSGCLAWGGPCTSAQAVGEAQEGPGECRRWGLAHRWWGGSQEDGGCSGGVVLIGVVPKFARRVRNHSEKSPLHVARLSPL